VSEESDRMLLEWLARARLPRGTLAWWRGAPDPDPEDHSRPAPRMPGDWGSRGGEPVPGQRLHLLAVTGCATCGAEAGSLCRSPNGTPRKSVHRSRLEALPRAVPAMIDERGNERVRA
jgi:hypothetical protein